MSTKLFFRFSRIHQAQPSCLQLGFESLESRTLLTSLIVDINDPNCGLAGDDLYCQIHEAIDSAAEGSTIEVQAGIYEPITLEKSNLTIRKASEDANPVIRGTDDVFAAVEVRGMSNRIEGLVVEAARHGFYVCGNNNTLVGNTAANGSSGFALCGNGVSLIRNIAVGNSYFGFEGSNNSTFIGNIARDNGHGGFSLGSLEGWGSGNVYRENIATGNAGAGFSLMFSAMKDNEFKDNLANRNDAAGFALAGHDNVLTGNTASENGGPGFLFYTTDFSNPFTRDPFTGIVWPDISRGNVLTMNVASDNGDSGFVFEKSIANTLVENNSRGNLGSGFDVVGKDNQFDGNSADDNGGFGFLVDNIMADLLTGNACTGNDRGGDNQNGELCKQPLPGDANLDGHVSFEDFLVLSANFGKQDAVWGDGDFTGDGQVTFEDFLLLSNNFAQAN